jgi:hypothetical protein
MRRCGQGRGIFGSALIAPARAGELALTFDDGPNPKWTPRLLEVLGEHGVKATFFMLGGRAQTEPALVRRIAAEGHLIGNHSWSHPNLALTACEQSARRAGADERDAGADYRGEGEMFSAAIRGAAAGGVSDCQELGLRVVTWNAMTSDWSETVGRSDCGGVGGEDRSVRRAGAGGEYCASRWRASGAGDRSRGFRCGGGDAGCAVCRDTSICAGGCLGRLILERRFEVTEPGSHSQRWTRPGVLRKSYAASWRLRFWRK